MFLLIETANRNTDVKIFPTYRQAQKAMNKSYEETIKSEDDNINEKDIDVDVAWIDTHSRYNYDWKIIDLDKIIFKSNNK